MMFQEIHTILEICSASLISGLRMEDSTAELLFPGFALLASDIRRVRPMGRSFEVDGENAE